MKQECPFCEAHKEQRILEETKNNFVIFSNPRIQPGHILVFPKRHVERLSQLKSNESTELFGLLCKYQEKILKNISSGCEVMQNFKPYLPNSRTHVNHLHFHLHPRNHDDQVALKVDKHRKPLYKDLSEAELKRMKSILSN